MVKQQWKKVLDKDTFLDFKKHVTWKKDLFIPNVYRGCIQFKESGIVAQLQYDCNTQEMFILGV